MSLIQRSYLENGDHMTQAEFHEFYKSYPKHVKFELIGGIVYRAAPVPWYHNTYRSAVNFVLGLYLAGTPGIELGANATIILGEQSEPQPNLALRLLPEYGGRSKLNDEQYLEGAPELLAEIAYSDRVLELHEKKQDYQQAGALEYVVLDIENQELYWFDFRSNAVIAPRQGVYRSRAFPGLWIDAPALLALDSTRLVTVVRQGLAHRSHTVFVKRLEAARRRNTSS